MKYNKLLGSGVITKKYAITTDYATKSAVAKVEALKGKVEVKFPSEE